MTCSLDVRIGGMRIVVGFAELEEEGYLFSRCVWEMVRSSIWPPISSPPFRALLP